MLPVGSRSSLGFIYFLLLAAPCVGFNVHGAAAQDWIVTEPLDVREAIQRAEAALERGDARIAVQILEEVTSSGVQVHHTDPKTNAAVRYHLGVAYRADGRPRKALHVWEDALSSVVPEAASRSVLPIAVRLKDAYVRTAVETNSSRERERAMHYYLNLLACAGSGFADRSDILHRHLRQVAVVLPDPIQRRTGLRVTPAMDVRVEPTADAGSLLVAWWRAQDLLPATPENERLEEHLLRVTHAEAEFQHNEAVDARGLVYIRFGFPTRTTSVNFDDPHFWDRVIRRNPTLSRFDFPDNEFWIYDELGSAAYYLFIEEGNGSYRVGDTKDLFPSTLKHGLSSVGRGSRKAYSLVHTMELVYRQLGLHHGSFLERYAESTNAAAELDMQAFAGGPVSVNGQNAFEYSQSFLSQLEQADADHRADREEQVPPFSSDLLESTPPLHVHVRHARFLDPNGTTRTEVYWTVGVEALVPEEPARGTSKDHYSLVSSAVQKTEDYETRLVDQTVRTVRPDRYEANGVLRPHTHILTGCTDTYHIAVQWDHHRLEKGRSRDTGPLIKRNVYRVDSLRALPDADQNLVVSDLKPLTLSNEHPPDFTPDLADTIPYPFAHLNPRTPLALYFEAYNLQFDASDRTQYTVAYEVRARDEKRGLWQRIFGGQDEQVTATEVTYTGNSATVREYIFIEQADWNASQQHEHIEINVKFTDETTGQTYSRSIQFVVDQSSDDHPRKP
jgi:GWxTD domain-containing protein